MFKKLIIATDLSEASNEMLTCSRSLSLLGTQEILLLQCVKTLDAASMAYSESAQKMQSILKQQEKTLTEQGFQTSSEVVFGSIHKEINRIAKEKDYSGIVIGSHGQSLAKDILLGSVASEIIQSALRPVLIVRLEIIKDDTEQQETCKLSDTCHDFRESVLFPTDFSHNADRAFLYVEKIVESGAKSVTLLHIQDMVKLERFSKEDLEEFDEIDRKRLEKLKERLLDINKNVKVELLLEHGKPSMQVVKVASEIKSSLIVMGSQGKGYVEELFIGSVSHVVCRNAKTSVLLVPSDKNKKGK